MTALPNAAWCQSVSDRLAQDAGWKKAVEQIGDPLYIKVKTDDEATAVLLAIGDGDAAPAVAPHAGDSVESADAIIVSMKEETWDRLLRGSTDLMTAFMSREIKAKASMMKLMKITDPAEKLIHLIAQAHQEAA